VGIDEVVVAKIRVSGRSYSAFLQGISIVVFRISLAAPLEGAKAYLYFQGVMVQLLLLSTLV
jgi:hypothetical protein